MFADKDWSASHFSGGGVGLLPSGPLLKCENWMVKTFLVDMLVSSECQKNVHYSESFSITKERGESTGRRVLSCGEEQIEIS